MATTISSTSPWVGELAPDFSLDSTAGTPVRLSDYRGNRNVLRAFFPLAFTSTCTAEVCEFNNTDVDRYAGASVDEERFFARRASVLVDRRGIIRWFHIEDQVGCRRQRDALLAKIGELD